MMTLQSMMAAGQLRAVLERLKTDPTYRVKPDQIATMLSPEQFVAFEAIRNLLNDERFVLFEPHSTISTASAEWWEDCQYLRREFETWYIKRDRMRRNSRIRVSWNYRRLSAFNHRAEKLALRFQALSERDQICFVTQAEPLYGSLVHGASADLSVALPYLRCGYEHRPELYDTTRTALIRTLAAIFDRTP